jgi:acylphosphatase
LKSLVLPFGANPVVEHEEAFQRREVYYRGRVQGVGFRYTAVRIAARFQVTGFVRNLPDGRVYLVAEGPPKEVNEFLEAIEQVMGRYIRGKTETTGPATGEFRDFGVRY